MYHFLPIKGNYLFAKFIPNPLIGRNYLFYLIAYFPSCGVNHYGKEPVPDGLHSKISPKCGLTTTHLPNNTRGQAQFVQIGRWLVDRRNDSLVNSLSYQYTRLSNDSRNARLPKSNRLHVVRILQRGRR